MSSIATHLYMIHRPHKKQGSKTSSRLIRGKSDDSASATNPATATAPAAAATTVKGEEGTEANEGMDVAAWASFYKAHDIRMVLVIDSTSNNKSPFLERQGSVALEVPGFTSISQRFIELCNTFINYRNTDEWFKARDEGVELWTSTIHDILFATVMASNMVATQKSSILFQPASNEEDDMISALSSLTALMVDSKARTIEGFIELVEREWIDFGFPYAKSYGDDIADITVNTVMLVVFLDCVWQLWSCFPESFEFNEAFLLFIAESIHSGRFGTFYTNICCTSCAAQLRAKAGIPSLWTYILTNKKLFVNPVCDQAALSSPITQRFSNEFVSPHLWTPFFMRWKFPGNEEKYSRQLRKFAPAASAQAAAMAGTTANANGFGSPSKVGLTGQTTTSTAAAAAATTTAAATAAVNTTCGSSGASSSGANSGSSSGSGGGSGGAANNNNGGNAQAGTSSISVVSDSLDFSNLGLALFPQVPVAYSYLSGLKELNLSKNIISALPSSLYLCNNLVQLSLSRNNLSAPFTEESLRVLSERMPKLMVLDLSYNKTVCLPSNFAALSSVRKLIIGGNCFKDVPKPIFEMRSLRSLSLEDGLGPIPLSAMPLSSLEILEELVLSKCKMTEVPAAELKGLKSLRILDLSYNEITSVDNFPYLPSLKVFINNTNIHDLLNFNHFLLLWFCADSELELQQDRKTSYHFL